MLDAAYPDWSNAIDVKTNALDKGSDSLRMTFSSRVFLP
jgi:hypothetical protein